MKFLNGFKTILGIAATVAGIVVPALGKDGGFIPALADSISAIGDNVHVVVTSIGGVLATLGIIHKREKATDPAVKEASEGTALKSVP